MNRKDKFTKQQKAMIKDGGNSLSDYMPVRVYEIKDGVKTEDKYLCLTSKRTNVERWKDWFSKERGFTFPSGVAYFFDDPELKIEENGEYYTLTVEQ